MAFLPSIGMSLLTLPAAILASKEMASVALPYWPVQIPGTVRPNLNLLRMILMASMFGSPAADRKPSYWMCHGSVFGDVVPL
jgi:hypothetical protein